MTILDVVDMGFKVLCVVEIGLIAWGWRVWREVVRRTVRVRKGKSCGIRGWMI